jgi:hypothetical protein
MTNEILIMFIGMMGVNGTAGFSLQGNTLNVVDHSSGYPETEHFSKVSNLIG